MRTGASRRLGCNVYDVNAYRPGDPHITCPAPCRSAPCDELVFLVAGGDGFDGDPISFDYGPGGDECLVLYVNHIQADGRANIV